jgi:ABC-type cobalamin/Fe3+-siderophores transport system ATPase subunit
MTEPSSANTRAAESVLFRFDVETPLGPQGYELKNGEPLFFVGANGSGKSRLALTIESNLANKGHRISAHRSLSMNTNVPKIKEELARNALKYGRATETANPADKWTQRWQIYNNGIDDGTPLLNDFDALLQTLFAEQSNTAFDSHTHSRKGHQHKAAATLLERIQAIWEHIIPSRRLILSGDDVQVAEVDSEEQYKASALSDGERAVFYLAGQALCADPNSVLIVDEPELHLHRAIMSKLWDAIESERPDCGYVFITHDLEFAATRVGQKYVVREYSAKEGDKWTIEKVPQETGFDEETVTLILGSRRPILFVEGTKGSLDVSIYRNFYRDYTVIPVGECEVVIHSVETMRRNDTLTRVKCAGIIDGDGRSQQEKQDLENRGIYVLPVSEIENIFLMNDVLRAIGAYEELDEATLADRIEKLTDAVIEHVGQGDNLKEAVGRYCKRRIDSILKRLDPGKSECPEDLETHYRAKLQTINVAEIAKARTTEIESAISSRDLHKILDLYDNKGLFSLVSQHIKKSSHHSEVKNWLQRVLRSGKDSDLKRAVAQVLPTINL